MVRSRPASQRSERAGGDSDGASSFLRMVAWMLGSHRDVLAAETERLLLRTTRRIPENQEYHDAGIDICGSFAELYAEIRKRAQGQRP